MFLWKAIYHSFPGLLSPFTHSQSYCLLRAKSMHVGTSAEGGFAVGLGKRTHIQLASPPCLLCSALHFQASSMTVSAPLVPVLLQQCQICSTVEAELPCSTLLSECKAAYQPSWPQSYQCILQQWHLPPAAHCLSTASRQLLLVACWPNFVVLSANYLITLEVL